MVADRAVLDELRALGTEQNLIEREVHAGRNRVIHEMNNALIAIALRGAPWRSWRWLPPGASAR